VSGKKLIAANWKMQKTIAGAKVFAEGLKSLVRTNDAYDMVVFPPFVALPVTAEILAGSPVAVGAQDIFWENDGAYTGEISAAMVIEAGGTHVIVGHSERRHVLGETNEIVGKKLRAAIRGGLTSVLCVGEKIADREAGRAEAVVKEQLDAALSGVPTDDAEGIVIAYEPVWAIGTGRTATPQDAVAMHRFIRDTMAGRFGSEAANRLRILYGGSVKPQNALRLLGEAEIDGALVGGASLEIDSFLQIAAAVR
jgi:triosephosphate isomerase (TIM)